MKPIPTETRFSEIVYPRPEQLASALGNHGVDVVSTVNLILYFEAAANNLVMPYYDDGEVSVGTHVNVDHLAPANGSDAITVEATLTRQAGRRLEFSVQALQNNRVVMRGEHHRAVMNRRDFSDPGEIAELKPKTIDFWFDFHSPWCYLASHKIGEIARQHSARLRWRPVHLANLISRIGGHQPLLGDAAFVAWYEQDQRDQADMLGLPFSPHADYPKRPSRALRAAIYAEELGLGEVFVKAVMRGYWSEQADISDLNWLHARSAELGLDGDAVEAAAQSADYKSQLEGNLDDAVKTKLFGLPAAVVDDKIFWGNDRLELLEHYLSQRPPTLR
ncbi:MAG: 2-hydroxychromene-2-carboxylate isomerase/predicted thioesterase [Planctomycetota bacterium]|jgi:2-hydroxychromene-2-carboxylate isomerase/predicted thioesterase